MTTSNCGCPGNINSQAQGQIGPPGYCPPCVGVLAAQVEEQMAALQGEVTAIGEALALAEVAIAEAEAAIIVLQGEMDNAEAAILVIQNQMIVIEGNIVTLTENLNALILEVQAIDARVIILESLVGWMEIRLTRSSYTVTSIVGVPDGGTLDSLDAVTTANLGFVDAAALETYLATGKIPIYVSGYRGPGDSAWGTGLVVKDAGLSALAGFIVAMPGLGADWYWVRDFVGPIHMSWAGVRPSVDNTTDQRATIQAVIDYAATLPERTVVFDVDGSNSTATNRYYIDSVHPSHTSYGLVVPSGVKLICSPNTSGVYTTIWAGPNLAGKRAVLTTTPNAISRGVFMDGIAVFATYLTDYAIQIGGAGSNWNVSSGYANCRGTGGVKGGWYINAYIGSFTNCHAGYSARNHRNGGSPVKSNWSPSNPVPAFDGSYENFRGFDIAGITSLVFDNCYAFGATVNWCVQGLTYSSFVGCASDSGELGYAFVGCSNILAQVGCEYTKMPLYVSATTDLDINIKGDPCCNSGTDAETNYYSDTQTDYLFEVAGASRVNFTALHLSARAPSMGGTIYAPARNFGKLATQAMVQFQAVGVVNYTKRVIAGAWVSGNIAKMSPAMLDVGYTGGVVNGGFSIQGIPGWMTVLGKEYYTHALTKPIIRTDLLLQAEMGNVLTKALSLKYTSSIVFPDGNPGSDFSEFLVYYSGLPNKWAAGVASDNGGTVRITSPGHTLSNGNSLCISEKYPYYQGAYTAANVTTDTFDITAAFRAYEATNIEWCTRKLTGSISTVRQGDYAGNSVFEYVVTNSFASPASSAIDINPTVIWNPMIARGKVVSGFNYRITDLGATSAFNGSNLFPVGTGLTFGNGAVVRVNQAGHGLVDGNAIVVSGTTSYNGTKYAQRIDDDNFNVYDNSTLTTPTTWVADEAGDYHTNVLNNLLTAKSTGYPTSWDTDAILRGEFALADAAASSVFKVRTVVQVEEVADKALAHPVWLERPVRFDSQV